MSDTRVTIDGITYDQQTGERLVDGRETPTTPRIVHSKARHHTYARREHHPAVAHSKSPLLHKTSRTITPKIAPSYAEHPNKPSVPVHAVNDKHIHACQHPIVEHAVRKSAKPQPVELTARQKKDSAIAHALAIAPTHHAKHRVARTPRQRRLSIVTASLALVLLAGYFSYLSMPALSTRVAAIQAGINASYPGYHPTGYRLAGPVDYSEGVVVLKFVSNTDTHSYTIAQHATSEPSNDISENFIRQHVGDSYITNRTGDLTIYSENSTAAWVHDSVLYTLTGDAPLSADQIARIATST